MRKKTIETARELAAERGWKCLSEAYSSAHSPLLWRCARGHEWEATPANIGAGRGCPHCSKKARLTIGQMREIANARGGACLSESLKNKDSKLLWRCAHGHEWEARASSVKGGGWCPHCAKKARKGSRIADKIPSGTKRPAKAKESQCV